MVEVLAQVVLVRAQRGVIGERQVLCVHEVERRRTVADVLESHVPEPRRGRFRQPQRHAEAQAGPFADGLEAAVVETEAGGAAWAEQRDPLDGLTEAAQEEVRRSALDLRAEVCVQDHVALIDAPDRTVRVQLYREPRRAREADGIRGADAVRLLHGEEARRTLPHGRTLHRDGASL